MVLPPHHLLSQGYLLSIPSLIRWGATWEWAGWIRLKLAESRLVLCRRLFSSLKIGIRDLDQIRDLDHALYLVVEALVSKLVIWQTLAVWECN